MSLNWTQDIRHEMLPLAQLNASSWAPRVLIIPFLACMLLFRPSAASLSHSADSVWQNATRLMESGRVLEGIRELDSLRVAGFSTPVFLSDYSHQVFRVIIPGSSDSTTAFLLSTPSEAQTDSVFPDRVSWRVTTNTAAKFPDFQYTAAFTYRKPYKLVFPGLGFGTSGGGLLSVPEAAKHSPAEAILLKEFVDRTDVADCMVCVDLNDTKSSAMDYLAKRISGMYDSIQTGNDLARYHAVSLRCYRRSWVYGRDGDFAAFVVFDRALGDLLRARGLRPQARSDMAQRIRFTVAIRSGIDIQAFSEAKLQSVLRAF